MSTTEAEIVDEEVEVARNLPAVRASEALIAKGELTVDEVVGQKDKIEQVMARVMKRDVHYGVIPGVGKPSLLKPGAEAINVALRLAPHYDSEKIWHDDGHLTVVTKCELRHIPTSLVVGTGEGLCTTKESRYAYRTAKRECPLCQQPQIRRSKNQPRSGDYDGANPSDPPGWYCWRKEGGCGANFAHDDQRITGQEEGKIANPDIPDSYNTVLKMSDKRALVAAVLNATAASDVFTQDVEDGSGGGASGAPEPAQATVAFDPGKQLLPTARRDRSNKAIVEGLQADQHMLASDVDWTKLLEEAAMQCMPPRSEWKKPQRDEFMFRWTNAIAKLLELAQAAPEAVYHPELGLTAEGDPLIVEAFEFAFGITLPLPLPEADPPESAEPDVVDGEVVEVTGDE